ASRCEELKVPKRTSKPAPLNPKGAAPKRRRRRMDEAESGFFSDGSDGVGGERGVDDVRGGGRRAGGAGEEGSVGAARTSGTGRGGMLDDGCIELRAGGGEDFAAGDGTLAARGKSAAVDG